MAIVEKEEWSKLQIAKFDDWVLSVGGNQHVLGWLIIFPPRSFEGSMVHLTDQELLEFRKIGQIAEDLLKECFNPDWFNYVQQGNNVKRIHIHLQPRYLSERVFEGHTFTDEGFIGKGTIRFLNDENLAQKDIVFKIVKKLRETLSKKDISDFNVKIIDS